MNFLQRTVQLNSAMMQSQQGLFSLKFVYVLWYFLLSEIFKTIQSFVILEIKYIYSMTRLIFYKSNCISYSNQNLRNQIMKAPWKKNMDFIYFNQGQLSLFTIIDKLEIEKVREKVLICQDILETLQKGSVQYPNFLLIENLPLKLCKFLLIVHR